MSSTQDFEELARRPGPTPVQERRLVARARRGDGDARFALVQAFLPAIVRMAQRLGAPGLDPLELVQEGVVGLLRALDPDRRAAAAEDRYAELLAAAEPGELRRLLAELSAREHAVLEALGASGDGARRHQQAGRRLGLAPDAVRRIERRARAKAAAAVPAQPARSAARHPARSAGDAALQLVDAREQPRDEHGRGVVHAEVAPQPDGHRQPPGGLAGGQRPGLGPAAAGLDEAQPHEPPHEVRVQPGLARERVQPDGPGEARDRDGPQRESRPGRGRRHG
jgi:hypothetical protein